MSRPARQPSPRGVLPRELPGHPAQSGREDETAAPTAAAAITTFAPLVRAVLRSVRPPTRRRSCRPCAPLVEPISAVAAGPRTAMLSAAGARSTMRAGAGVRVLPPPCRRRSIVRDRRLRGRDRRSASPCRSPAGSRRPLSSAACRPACAELRAEFRSRLRREEHAQPGPEDRPGKQPHQERSTAVFTLEPIVFVCHAASCCFC